MTIDYFTEGETFEKSISEASIKMKYLPDFQGQKLLY